MQTEAARSFRPSQNYGEAYRPSLSGIPAAPKAAGGTASTPRPFISTSFDQATIEALRAMERTDTNKLRELNLALSGLFELQRETRGDPAVVQAIAKVRAEIDALTNTPVPDPGPTKAYADALAALSPRWCRSASCPLRWMSCSRCATLASSALRPKRPSRH